ncbi:bifunctional diguanylate cyclase/phosphodiesterase [Anaerocolumna xylanovorans]|uniref:Diguanylate cyclase (GGDEF) domain-containing protein n=1 Tax=Anaerocolumna xylanovorans DSM 12503 TaxID=1121345 RepID=A0A1M7YE63_9FIRM|nr:bifunctional diguanylate cyclase/phosphodiesterase [Anaerocolumna xylanovorans]SHO50869.1 diguanylate cyclase (GGDEF) domain-containing protein [Anaerocolumna xylanovorans DSM 12503]
MSDIRKNTFPKRYIYTEEQLIDFFTGIFLPEGVISDYVQKDNCIEFICNDTVYCVLMDGSNWNEIKQELRHRKELKIMEKNRIMEQEKLDTLTGLYHKEYSRTVIEEFLKVSGPEQCHALMLVDIDNFDAVNENLGYLFGDTVLVNIAEALRKNFYDTDIASRIGGDEFLIFIKNVTNTELLKEKARIIYSVFANTYTGENKNYKLSCSIGISTYPNDGTNFDELFLKADAALLYDRENKTGNEKFDYGCFFHEIVNPVLYLDKDCFEKYHINRTKGFGSNNFDKEITAFAFDIMSRTKDVNSAINLLLNKVRVQFGCTQICIFEYASDSPDFKLTYICSNDRMEANEKEKEEFAGYLDGHAFTFSESGVYSLAEIQDKDRKEETLRKLGVKALLQCGIFENDSLKGCISVHDYERLRNWSDYEVDSFLTITKVISSYLLKLRASERASKQLYKMRNFDVLTGLPTLHKFKKDARSIKNNSENKCAIIYSDITKFKYINNTLGYEIGDRILCDFASIIAKENGSKEGIARISDDNFAVCLSYRKEDEIIQYIQNVYDKFSMVQKSKYPGTRFIVASGIALVDPGEDITVAIDNANVARKTIKNTSKSTYCFFDINMQLNLKKEAEINNTMEQALKDREFVVYLQPKVSLQDNSLVGAEALVRWIKDGIIILPGDFIPIFENNGFVVNLDFYIYEEVCKIIRGWLEQGKKPIPISVNVSRVHLHDERFVDEIKKLADSYEIPYNLLELELTESIFLNNTEAAISAMKRLRSLGFGVSIDDFGAGYSSLNLLKDMATDVIKLDKEFFGHDNMQREEQIIVSSIISMAKQLNMKVLSEGVETQNQSDFLKSVLCDMAQGYLYSRPIPVAEFEKLI